MFRAVLDDAALPARRRVFLTATPVEAAAWEADVDEEDVLLLLHGNPTWSFLYRHVIGRLRHRFRCIALDFPGFGLS